MGDLFDFRMNDGSRNFAGAPWMPAVELRRRVERLPGAAVTALIDTPIETWIDFTYGGFRFSAHNPMNEFWLFVEEPGCPDEILQDVESACAGGKYGVSA
jgi:hypothetical protein